MKRGFWILMMVCAVLTTVSCQNKAKKNTPEAATEQFAKAFYTADFTHMYQYTTKKSDIVIKQLQNGMKDNTERLEEMKKAKVEFVSTSVNNLTDSTCSCECKILLNGQPRQNQWDLLKEDDLWKVTLVLP
ncbi:MAG: DUF4878 domain-containing protein [Bacteroidales bacterium]|nr:DUF4878 domain-containing protein [Bacteroidales bacterium]